MQTVDKCLKCNDCIVVCPVRRANPSYPGPKTAGPELERWRLVGGGYRQAVELCTNCKLCETQCPHGVEITDGICEARAQLSKPFVRGIRDKMLGQVDLLGQVSTRIAPVVNTLLGIPLLRKVMERTAGISAENPLPTFAQGSLMQRLKNRKGLQSDKKVLFFPGCALKYNTPELGLKIIELMESLGYQVLVPELKCCGAPLIVNGQMEQAKDNAVHNMRILKPYLEQGIPIIGSEPTCTLTLKKEYAGLLQAPDAGLLLNKVFDLSQWLVQNGSSQESTPAADKKTVAYFVPCHVRGQGMGLPTARLLKMLGLEVVVLESQCCGLSGTYGYKKEKNDISRRLGQDLANELAGQSYDWLVTECFSCAARLKQLAGKEVYHPVEIMNKLHLDALLTEPVSKKNGKVKTVQQAS